MWLYILALPLLAVGIIGGLLGGAPLFVLVPVAFILLGLARRRRRGLTPKHRREVRYFETTVQPLPHSAHETRGHVPTTPEALLEARRAMQ